MVETSEGSVAARSWRRPAAILALGLVVGVVCSGLTGCGQRGPLTLPAPATAASAAR